MKAVMNTSPEFLRFYMGVMWREYRIRKASSPLGKQSYGFMLLGARRAQIEARAAAKPVQGDLFGSVA